MATVQRIPSSTVQSSKEPTASDVLRTPMHPCVHMCVMCVHACLCVRTRVCACVVKGKDKDNRRMSWVQVITVRPQGSW